MVVLSLDPEELALLQAAAEVDGRPLVDAARALLLRAVQEVEGRTGAEFYDRLHDVRKRAGLIQARRGGCDRH